MLQCWRWSPADRPAFRDVHRALGNIFPASTIEDEVCRAARGDAKRRSKRDAAKKSASVEGGQPRRSPPGQLLLGPAARKERSSSRRRPPPLSPDDFPPPPPDAAALVSPTRGRHPKFPLIPPKAKPASPHKPAASPLAEAAVAAAHHRSGTLPKHNRIGAYLESLEGSELHSEDSLDEKTPGPKDPNPALPPNDQFLAQLQEMAQGLRKTSKDSSKGSPQICLAWPTQDGHDCR